MALGAGAAWARQLAPGVAGRAGTRLPTAGAPGRRGSPRPLTHPPQGNKDEDTGSYFMLFRCAWLQSTPDTLRALAGRQAELERLRARLPAPCASPARR